MKIAVGAVGTVDGIVELDVVLDDEVVEFPVEATRNVPPAMADGDMLVAFRAAAL